MPKKRVLVQRKLKNLKKKMLPKAGDIPVPDAEETDGVDLREAPLLLDRRIYR
jgi:hypothetical protein